MGDTREWPRFHSQIETWNWRTERHRERDRRDRENTSRFRAAMTHRRLCTLSQKRGRINWTPLNASNAPFRASHALCALPTAVLLAKGPKVVISILSGDATRSKSKKEKKERGKKKEKSWSTDSFDRYVELEKLVMTLARVYNKLEKSANYRNTSNFFVDATKMAFMMINLFYKASIFCTEFTFIIYKI